ncbi:MAG TPA: tetratricopeptide repeat protein [Bacteroidia bacterium]
MKKIILIFTMSGIVFSAAAQSDKLADAFSKSYQLETKADYSNAIKALKDIYDAKSYEMNLRLGWLNYEAGLFTESQAYYEKAIALMPYSIEAKLGYVYPSSALGNWDKVITQYNSILATDPQNTTVNYRLGNIYYGKKDYANAYKYFEKVVNLYPFGYDALLMFAWCNYQTGKTREAKVLFNKVLLASPGDKSALEGLGLIK